MEIVGIFPYQRFELIALGEEDDPLGRIELPSLLYKSRALPLCKRGVALSGFEPKARWLMRPPPYQLEQCDRPNLAF